MKILHLSSSDTGGAGIAALRLHKAMLSVNLLSSFLCLKKTSELNSVIQYPKFYPRFYHRFSTSLGFPYTHTEKNYKRINELTRVIGPEMYSFPDSDYKIHEHQLFKEADVIIIHWVAGFLDYKSFFTNIPDKKKVFWYAHDFSSILGGFHTLFDDERFGDEGIQIGEEKLKLEKQKYISNCRHLNFIGNSKFTYKILLESGIVDKKFVHCVPLGIPRKELNRIEKALAKKVLGLDDKKFIIAIASASLAAKRKGLERLYSIFDAEKDLKDLTQVVTIGSEQPNELSAKINIRHFGSVWNPVFKSIIFSAADVVVSTSYEETFGQTIIEGYACGTPAIVFNNSALPELIVEGKTGYVANTIEDFTKSLLELSKDNKTLSAMSTAAYQLFKDKYTSEHQVNVLLKLLTI
jgi:glycosyltransferase involved in cell wall biosynthesis